MLGVCPMKLAVTHWIALIGSVSEGFGIWGPFASEEEAIAWADAAEVHADVQPVNKPDWI